MNEYFRNKIQKELENIKDMECQNLINELKKEPYYLENKLERYLEYSKVNNKKKIKDIIREVNSNRDFPFYHHLISAEPSKKELILVNKYYYLKDNYIPPLVEMEENYAQGLNRKITKETYYYFKAMVDKARQDKIILYSVSSFRSYEYQKKLYQDYVLKDGEKVADTYSARAGHSEHETGYAIDINTTLSSAHFEDSKEFLWLQKNASKYGFILRYPQDKENITGFKFEPWHYRFVGIKVAQYLKVHHLTLEEYYAYFVENK